MFGVLWRKMKQEMWLEHLCRAAVARRNMVLNKSLRKIKEQNLYISWGYEQRIQQMPRHGDDFYMSQGRKEVICSTEVNMSLLW